MFTLKHNVFRPSGPCTESSFSNDVQHTFSGLALTAWCCRLLTGLVGHHGTAALFLTVGTTPQQHSARVMPHGVKMCVLSPCLPVQPACHSLANVVCLILSET